jgi:4-hydroxy-tetrahydrodipicolinate synthase
MIIGSIVALVTPMLPGSEAIDYPALRRLVDWHQAAGTAAIVAVGTTGESPTLSVEEHLRVVEVCVEQAAGRLPIIAGTGANSTTEAIELTTGARECGADACLLITPYYNKPTQEGFYLHFKALAEAVDIPICVYNIPGRAAKNIEPDTIIRMGELKNITMVKEATGSLDQASQILNASDLTLLSGDDSLTLPLLSVGGEGVISVVGNIVPTDMSALCRAFAERNNAEACRLHHKLFHLCRDLLGLSTNPIPIKAAMKLLGRDTGELRLPMTPLEAASEAKLKKTLAAYGLLAG